MEDKVYYPEVIETQAFPETVMQEDSASGSTEGKSVIYPLTKVNESFPSKNVARELISQTLDTHKKRILGEFTFGQVGAIAIGVYENGVSGDIRITPNGLVARDINGDTTISIDGGTGDAVFKGTVQAGSLISGNLVLGGALNEDGTLLLKNSTGTTIVTLDKDGVLVEEGKIVVKNQDDSTIIDAYGISSVNAFAGGSVQGSGTQSTTSGSYQEATGLSISFTLDREQNVLLFGTLLGRGDNGASPSTLVALLSVDNGTYPVGALLLMYGKYIDSATTVTAPDYTTMQEIISLPAGTHTLEVDFYSSGGDSVTLYKSNSVIGYLVLGN